MMTLYLLAGLSFGVLVNYLADVLPATRRLVKPDWWPVSGAAIAKYLSRPRVIFVFAFCFVAALLLAQYPPPEFSAPVLGVVLAYFLTVAVIDVEHRVVMHPVSIAGAVLMAAIGMLRGHTLVGTLLGGAAGFGFMLAVYYLGDWIGRLMARARREAWKETALGFGDVNLAGVIGLLMGWPGVIAALFFGMLAAGVFSAGYLLVTMVSGKYKAFSSIPYAPFLCLGALASVLLGVYS